MAIISMGGAGGKEHCRHGSGTRKTCPRGQQGRSAGHGTRAMAALTALALASGCVATGCSTLNPMERTIGKLGAAIEKKIADEGVLESWATAAEGDVFNPGAEAYVCLATGVRLVGVQGRLTAQAGGDSTRLPAGVREALITQLSQPISDEQRAGILQILGWNRTNPATGTTGKLGG